MIAEPFTCPFVESESSPFTRVMLLVVFIIFLAGIIFSLLAGPELKPKKSSPSEYIPTDNSLRN